MKTIYLSGTGNDFQSGLSKEEAVRTLAHASELLCQDGMTLLIEGGFSYDGYVAIEDLKDIKIGSYGDGYPIIHSGNHSAIALLRCKNITVSGLKLVGRGFRFCNGSMGVRAESCENVLIKNIEASGFHQAGIHVGGCVQAEILGCFAHDNGSVGITSGSYEGKISEHIRIAHCRAYDNAGDYQNRENHSGSGIIIGGTDHSVVEFCEAAGNGWAQRQIRVNGPVGMWCCCGCTDVVFRYNISRYNRTQPGAIDGDGLDIDGEVKDGVMEYNYTYGNEGSGYLLCEFWGDCSETLWENNRCSYCVSFADDTRVGGYGAINMSSPYDIPFEKMTINDNLLLSPDKMHCVINKNIPETAKDMLIENNVLVSDGTPAIQAPDQPYMTIRGNKIIEDDAVRQSIIQAAPLLTQPRDLLKQPVFSLLENGTCYDVLTKEGPEALFVHTSEYKQPEGECILDLQMYGPDYDGCDKSGNTYLYYDSIRPGMVTALNGEGSEFYTPLPWWNKDKNYLIRATARLQAPDATAYLFLRDAEGNEKRVYLSGSVADYETVELAFDSCDNWNDSGKYIGIHYQSGTSNVYVTNLEFIELKDTHNVTDGTLSLSTPFASFGDCYKEKETITLTDGAAISYVMDRAAENFYVTLSYESETNGMVRLVGPEETAEAAIVPGTNTVSLTLHKPQRSVRFSVSQDCFAKGTLKITQIK